MSQYRCRQHARQEPPELSQRVQQRAVVGLDFTALREQELTVTWQRRPASYTGDYSKERRRSDEGL